MVYLVLTASPTVYMLQSVTPFTSPPVNPGSTLVLPVPAPAAVVIGELTRERTESLRIFKEYTNVGKACKKIITKLVKDVYY